MMQKKEKDTIFARDFRVVHDTIRDMCARGYRSRQDYKRIGVGSSTYDNHLRRQIESMLNETDAFQNNRFVYKPMEWQENPLAGVFRYVIPDEQKFVYYYGIMSILAKQYKEDLAYFSAETGVEGLEISDICDEMQVYSKDGKEISYRQVRRKLLDLKEQYVISEIKGSDGEIRFKLNDPVWDCFELDELNKIYDCLCFLENVELFGLPYFLLRKNLELWMRKSEKEEWDAYDKDLFLFRHRNPLTILDSEIIYECLSCAKKEEKNISCYLNLDPYEFMNEVYDEKSEEHKEFKYKYLPVVLNPKQLDYDCYTGLVTVSDAYVKGEDEEKSVRKIPIRNLVFLDKHKLKEGKVSFLKKNVSQVENIFHNINSIYFERLIELRLQDDRNAWTKEELIDHFFRGKEYWYSDVFDRIVLGKKKTVLKKDKPKKKVDETKEENGKIKADRSPKIEVTCFRENQEKGTFERVTWDVKEQEMFYTPRLAIEALKSIPKMKQFTEYFFDEELLEKIRTCTADYELTWNVNDIVWVNRKDSESTYSKEEKIVKIKELIRKFRESGLVYDKSNKEYYMLRLEYSLYKDEFRVLVQETSGEERLMILTLEDIMFKKRFADKEKLREVRNNYTQNLSSYMKKMEFRLCNKAKVDWSDISAMIEQLEEKCEALGETKQYVERVKKELESYKAKYSEFDKMQWDNFFTDGWMSLLSTYEHQTTYIPSELGLASGDFQITLWYWAEDEEEILDEFRNFKSVFEMRDLKIT